MKNETQHPKGKLGLDCMSSSFLYAMIRKIHIIHSLKVKKKYMKEILQNKVHTILTPNGYWLKI